MKSGMHVCSPDMPHSKLLSKHPRFTLVRLKGILRRRGGNQPLSNDSSGVHSFLCGSILYKAPGHRCYYPLYSLRNCAQKRAVVQDLRQVMSGFWRDVSVQFQILFTWGHLGARSFQQRVDESSGNIPFQDSFQRGQWNKTFRERLLYIYPGSC